MLCVSKAEAGIPVVLVVFWIIRKELVRTLWEGIIQGAAVPPFQRLDGDVSAGTGGGMELGKAGAQVGGCLVSKAQRPGRQKQSEDHVKKTEQKDRGAPGMARNGFGSLPWPSFPDSDVDGSFATTICL